MTLSVIIPIRPFGEGKTRLAGVMDVTARARLAERMFHHVVAIATTVGQTTVVGHHMPMLLGDERFVEDAGAGLNRALDMAALTVHTDAPALALFADLPLLGREDILAMTALLGQADVIAAADRHGRGTNALLLARPGLIPYGFGPDSLARHRALAEARALRFAIVQRRGLATDIDTPSDLLSLPATWRAGSTRSEHQAICDDRRQIAGNRGSPALQISD